MPIFDSYYNTNINNIKEKLENISTGIKKIDTNKCSRNCCKFTQWKLPNELIDLSTNINNYIPTNMSCNFGNGSGCLCVTNDDYNYLANRAQL